MSVLQISESIGYERYTGQKNLRHCSMVCSGFNSGNTAVSAKVVLQKGKNRE